MSEPLQFILLWLATAIVQGIGIGLLIYFVARAVRDVWKEDE
jgi:xanthine/uracil/vitamin C permease (AzgA family)